MVRIGIIAEGRADLAVIRNLLKGVCDIDNSDIQHISPEYDCDETDLAQMAENEFGSWTLVKKKCQEMIAIKEFFQVEGERFLIIQIDSDNRNQKDYDVLAPAVLTTKDDIQELRQNIITKIKEWLNSTEFDARILYAVAIDATESWVLSLYTNDDETGLLVNPKKRLHDKINSLFPEKQKKQLFALKMYDYFFEISKDFRKSKPLKPCLPKNQSLQDFVQALNDIIVHQLAQK